MAERITTSEGIEALLSASGVEEDVRRKVIRYASRIDSQPAKVDLSALIAREGSAPGRVLVYSVRMRHWTLHLGALMEMAAGALAAVGCHSPERSLFCGGRILVALRAMVGASTVSLGEREARLLVNLWCDDAPRRIRKATARARSGLPEDQFEETLNALVEVRAIDIDADEWVVRTDYIVFV